MERGIFICPTDWECWLPPQVRRLRTAGEAEQTHWRLLALTPEGCGQMTSIHSDILLIPGGQGSGGLRNLHSEYVVTYGLSRKDSLTMSSLERPMLCVQRSLFRMDGGVIEPQEIPLPPLPYPAEELLPLFGLYLLRMPLTGTELFATLQKKIQEGYSCSGSF